MKKKILISFLFVFLLLILVYVTNITSIPKSIVLFKSEKLNMKLAPGVILKTSDSNNKINNNEVIETSVQNRKK